MNWLLWTAVAHADVVPINPIADPPRDWQGLLIGAVVAAVVIGGVFFFARRKGG
ncbi:MAG: hypothetical protein GY913_10410 [Proteobacteria bacterium]|nr:hypothetical protein [Pseudomonadota bacterium]MCP4917325.1 hypothetical protein [Pseudomonadota bacterium]